MDKSTSNFLELIRLLKKWFWFITVNFIIVCAITIFISLKLPNIYKASTTVILPASGGLSGVSSLLSSLPLQGLGIGGSGDIYRLIAILNSRTVMEKVVDKFGLIEKYEEINKEEAVRTLRGNVEFTLTEEGTLDLTVFDEDPQAAADMANNFAQLLDEKNRELDSEAARNTRENIESRYNENIKSLQKVQADLQNFQEKYNAISLTGQTEQATSGVAELTGSKYQAEVQLEILKSILGKNHSKVRQAELEVEAYKNKISEITFEPGKGYILNEEKAKKLFIPLNKVPELGNMYIDLERELKTQNEIYILLTQQLELAKIEEVIQPPSLQIIDKAVPPLRKAKPKRAVIVIIACLSALVLSVIFISFYEYYIYARAQLKQ